jgi:hypothetical protein
MTGSSDDAAHAVRYALGDDAQDTEVAALAARLQQPAEVLSDAQLAVEGRTYELEMRRKHRIHPQ